MRGDSKSTRAARTATALLLGLMLAVAVGCGPDPLVRPDLVLVTTGAFSIEEAACHGGREEAGAELCAIGDEGTRYVWAFSAAADPAPDMASILTGLPADVHGVDPSAARFLRSDLTTLAEQLQSAGYSTAAFVTNPALNRSRHFDQGFATFDDGTAEGARADEAAADAAGRAAQWLAQVESPYFAWVHLDPRRAPQPDREASEREWEPLRALDRSLSRLLAVVEARPTTPSILVTSLPPHRVPPSLAPVDTRVALLWRPSRFGSSPGVARVIRTPVSQLDIAPTLLRAGGLMDAADTLPGQVLPFRERRADEPDRHIEIQGGGAWARIGDGEYVIRDVAGTIVATAPLPLAGERAPRLGSR